MTEEELRKELRRLDQVQDSVLRRRERRREEERSQRIWGSGGWGFGGAVQGEGWLASLEHIHRILAAPGFRVLVATIITVFALPPCFYVVLSGPKFDETARNFAAGTIGVIIGFWLKP